MNHFLCFGVFVLALTFFGGGVSANVLTDDEIKALRLAFLDEHKAKATYENVMEDLGEIRPFSNIIQAEERHIQALERLFEKYGVKKTSLPSFKKKTYTSRLVACEEAIKAEIENAKLYDRIMEMTDRDDIKLVFRNLRDASQERHLPAFRRCMLGGPGKGMGRGASRGLGRGANTAD